MKLLLLRCDHNRYMYHETEKDKVWKSGTLAVPTCVLKGSQPSLYIVVRVHAGERERDGAYYKHTPGLWKHKLRSHTIMEEPRWEPHDCLNEQTPAVTDNQVASSNVCLVPFTSHSNPQGNGHISYHGFH